MELGGFGEGNKVGEIAGRMGFHFLMVLVGLLEASIAAKREQDYCLPIEWQFCFGGVRYFFPTHFLLPLHSYIFNHYYCLLLLL